MIAARHPCFAVLVCALVLYTSGSAFGQRDVKERVLFPIRENGLAGYIDRTGKVVIEPRFKWAGEFHEGLAWVVDQDGRKKFIDVSGATAFSSPFDGHDSLTFSEGFAVGRLGLRSALINRKGKLFPLQFDVVRPFREGLAAACIGDTSNLPGEHRVIFMDYWGFIDKHGRWQIPAQYLAVRDFTEGMGAVYVGGVNRLCTGLGGGKWGYIDRIGVMVIKPRFDRAHEFSEGLAAVQMAGRWSYIDTTGAMVIPPTDSNVAGRFSEGLAYVRFPTNGSCGDYGYIDRTGRVVIRPDRGLFAYDFSEGLVRATKGGAFGYIDRSGKWRIAPGFREAEDFRNGLARVVEMRARPHAGYIDHTGRFVWRSSTPLR